MRSPMKSSRNAIDRWPVYISAGFLSFCGVMVFSIMPLVVSVIQRRYGFREAQIGDAIGCYFGGVTIISCTSIVWIRRLDWRVLAAVGQFLAFAALVALGYVVNFHQLATAMVVAGIGGGISYSLMLTIVGDSDDADRAYAVNLLFQAFPVVILMLLLPRLFANDGSDMRFLAFFMAAIVFVIGFGIPSLPRRGTKGGVASGLSSARDSSILPPLIGITVTFLFMVGCTAPWIFIEEAARAKGLAPLQIGYGLAGATFAAVVGSVIAAVIGDKFGKWIPACFGVAAYLLGICLLDLYSGFEMFAVAAFLYYLPSNFLLAFSLGLTSEVDLRGRVISLSAASVLAPSLVCPPIAGRLYEAYGFRSNLALGAASAIAGLVLYAYLLRLANSAADRSANQKPLAGSNR